MVHLLASLVAVILATCVVGGLAYFAWLGWTKVTTHWGIVAGSLAFTAISFFFDVRYLLGLCIAATVAAHYEPSRWFSIAEAFNSYLFCLGMVFAVAFLSAGWKWDVIAVLEKQLRDGELDEDASRLVDDFLYNLRYSMGFLAALAATCSFWLTAMLEASGREADLYAITGINDLSASNILLTISSIIQSTPASIAVGNPFQGYMESWGFVARLLAVAFAAIMWTLLAGIGSHLVRRHVSQERGWQFGMRAKSKTRAANDPGNARATSGTGPSANPARNHPGYADVNVKYGKK